MERAGRRAPESRKHRRRSRILAEYERGDDSEDSYRHRMLVNLAALLVIVVLSVAGAWLAMQIAELRKNQDCVLSGRRNCMPIEVNTR